MAYDNIPAVHATFLDGAFKEPVVSTQPKILFLGTGNSGLTYELFNVGSIKEAELEFGAATEVLRGVHEAVGQNANNAAVLRIGGKQGNLLITDANGGTLQITPDYRDDLILERYSLVMTVEDNAQRILIWDIEKEQWVYDSEELLAINTDVIRVAYGATALDLFSSLDDADTPVAVDIDNPLTFVAMADQTSAQFNQEGTYALAALSPVVQTAGTDGTGCSYVERYAALNQAYHLLDFQDADIICPVDAPFDAPNVTDGVATNFFFGCPVAGDANDMLGYLWQYIYRGKLHTFFTDSDSFFADEATADSATLTLNADLVFTATKTGVGGNSILVQLAVDGDELTTTAGITVTQPTPTSLKILITTDAAGGVDNEAAAALITTKLEATMLSNGRLASEFVTVTGGATVLPAALIAETPLAGGLGGAYLSHTDLTRDVVAAAATTRFVTDGQDAELREANFGHQLASFCHKASTTWKSMLGTIALLGPAAYDRISVAEWAGQLPTYKTLVGDKVIDTTGLNGVGILGNKFLAGKAPYRNAAVDGSDGPTDGKAYGGLILTVGASLPNGADYAYGVSDTDEALDSGGEPIDIGRNILVTYDYPIHRNSYNGGSTYRGNLACILAGKIATTNVKEEPIGDNGLIVKVTSPPKVHATLKNDLAGIRTVGLRREEGLGYILVSTKTAAHPDSDYTRLSTIRSVNYVLSGIRNIAKAYIGREFSSTQLVALQGAIDGFLQSQRVQGYHQGAAASLSYSRSDKIIGRLAIRLRMVPPFSIELITVETSLAADESEL